MMSSSPLFYLHTIYDLGIVNRFTKLFNLLSCIGSLMLTFINLHLQPNCTYINFCASDSDGLSSFTTIIFVLGCNHYWFSSIECCLDCVVQCFALTFVATHSLWICVRHNQCTILSALSSRVA